MEIDVKSAVAEIESTTDMLERALRGGDVIAGEFGDYSAVLAKIAALVDDGSLVRIKCGLYYLSPKNREGVSPLLVDRHVRVDNGD